MAQKEPQLKRVRRQTVRPAICGIATTEDEVPAVEMMDAPHAYDDMSRQYDREQGRDPEATVYINCDAHDLPIRVRPRNGAQGMADIYWHAPVECCDDGCCHRQVCDWYESAAEITGTMPIDEHRGMMFTQSVAATQCWLRPVDMVADTYARACTHTYM